MNKNTKNQNQKVVIIIDIKLIVKSTNLQFKIKLISLENPMEFADKYTLLQSIATSSNNDVYRAKRNSDSKIFMVKKVHYSKMQQKQKQQVVQQVNILTEISSQHVVKYCQHFIQKHQNTLYVVMQFQPMDLSHLIKKYQEQGRRFSQQKVWKFFVQIILALKQIHKHKKGIILHRNIQPKSIFINNTSIKLGNFKFVKKLDIEQQFATTVLTDTYYLSPQQLKDSIFTPKTDIWALGCLIYELCTFSKPFQGSNVFQIGNKIKQGIIKSLPSNYKKQLNRVIRWCLAKDPRDRPSVEDLLSVPSVNLLIRQNRLSQINRRISQKQNKNLALEQQVQQLQKRIQMLKMKQEKLSSIYKSKKDLFIEQDKQNYQFLNKKSQQLVLRKGISEKLSERSSYLRNTSGGLSQLSNYMPSTQKINLIKIRQSKIKPDQKAFRQLNF